MLNSTARTERRIERSRIACDVNNVQDAISGLSKLMAGLDDAMKETRDGSVEADLASTWEAMNDTLGKLIKIRSRLETA
jgi:hypothetical protein